MSHGGVFAASAPYPTRSYGVFRLFVTDRRDASAPGGQDLVLVKGDVVGRTDVLCRITSRCIMSTALDAYDCDCADQTRLALNLISQHGAGLLIYLDQEGRGHGLPTKVRAMELKAKGFDTYSAFEAMGLEPDITSYSSVIEILGELGVLSISLITNNPAKRNAIANLGVTVTGLVPCVPTAVPSGALRHLRAKQQRGHDLELPRGIDAL